MTNVENDLPKGEEEELKKQIVEEDKDAELPIDLVSTEVAPEKGAEDKEDISVKRKEKSRHIYNGVELLNMKMKHLPTLVKPIIQKVGLIALIGTSDVGKSTLLLQLCSDVVLSDAFLGFSINATHKSSIYVSTEDDKYSISYRMQRFEKGNLSKVKNMKFIFSTFNIAEQIEAELKIQKADIVVVDTFSDIFPGEMNQVNKVRYFMNEFYELAMKYECLIVFNHHTGKYTEEKPPNKTNSIGSAGFVDKCRMVMELRRDYNDETKRHLCIVKGNHLGPEFKISSYELDFNQTQGFTITGKRESFDNLAKPKYGKVIPSKIAEKTEAIKLKAEGKSVRQIVEKLKDNGVNVSKSTVGEWTKKCPSKPAA